jgi:hypothetical protein
MQCLRQAQVGIAPNRDGTIVLSGSTAASSSHSPAVPVTVRMQICSSAKPSRFR